MTLILCNASQFQLQGFIVDSTDLVITIRETWICGSRELSKQWKWATAL